MRTYLVLIAAGCVLATRAPAAVARAEHERNMAQYKRDIDRIRQDIRAIDRKDR